MLNKLFEKILREYPICRERKIFSGNSMGMLVRRDLPGAIHATNTLGDSHVIKGSVGQGNWATVPWVAIMDTRLTKTTQSGIYIVYLFARDGSSLYLTLNQGCTDIIQKKGRNAAHKEMMHTAHKVRMMISNPVGFTAANDITLGNAFYESGCIFYRQYKAGCLPDDEILITDLKMLLSVYAQYCDLVKPAHNPASIKSIPEVRDEAMDYEHRSNFNDKSSILSNNKHSTIEQEQVTSKNQALSQVDFSKPQLCQETYPVSCIINGAELFGKNWARLLVAITEMFIEENNPNITALYKQGLFQRRRSEHPFIMDSRIIGLHCAQLSNGYWINLNYSIPRLVTIISRLCVYCGVSLDKVFITYAPKDFSVDHGDVLPTGLAKITSKIDTDAVNKYIRQQGLAGATANNIISALNLQSRSFIEKIIDSETDIITLPDGTFIHRSNVVDIDEAAETLLGILQMQFRQFDGYSNYRLLFDAAKINLSLFMNDNAFEDEATIYVIAKHLFSKENYGGNQFVFYGNTHIWETEPEYPMTMRGILMYQARLNGGRITRTDCEVFLDKIKMGQGNFNQTIQSGSDSTFYRYAPGEFLLSEMLHIDEDYQKQIQRALDDLFEENTFVIPRDISDRWYEKMPEIPPGITWTPLLLQEVLSFNPAVNYKPVFAPLEQSRDTIAAAFIPFNSDMTFADVVSAHLSRVMDLPRRMGTEDLRLILRESGMIGGNELIYNMHRALNDYRFAWSDGNKTVYIRNG